MNLNLPTYRHHRPFPMTFAERWAEARSRTYFDELFIALCALGPVAWLSRRGMVSASADGATPRPMKTKWTRCMR